MKLYVDMMSEPSRAVCLFCELNSITYEKKQVKIARGETRSAEFRALNPMMQVPVLVDDSGFKLAESHAIMRYLADSRRVPSHWYPADPKQRARVDRVLDWHHNNLRRGCTRVVFNVALAPLYGVPPASDFSEDIALLQRSLAVMNGWLGECTYIAGPELSIADISLGCQVAMLELLPAGGEYVKLEEYPRVLAWMDALRRLPKWEEIHSAMLKIVQKRQSKL